jgi:hypothetical protein
MIIKIDPRVDIVFHNLFGSLEHLRLTMSLVNSLLGRVNLGRFWGELEWIAPLKD